MVIGVDRLLGAKFTAEHLDGTVRDDLVGVHVGLRAGTGLCDNTKTGVPERSALARSERIGRFAETMLTEDDRGEVVKQLARDDLWVQIRAASETSASAVSVTVVERHVLHQQRLESPEIR